MRIVRHNNNTQQQQNALFDLAGAPAPAPTVVRYGDREFIATATERAPLVGSTTTTDAPQPVAAATATDAPPQPQPAVIASYPDPEKPERWQLYTCGGDTNKTRVRLEKFGVAQQRVLDVLADLGDHHASELYKAAGGMDAPRVVRSVRQLVGRTEAGALVYAWLILCRIDDTTGAGVYRLDWRDRPQPKSDNGQGAGQ